MPKKGYMTMESVKKIVDMKLPNFRMSGTSDVLESFTALPRTATMLEVFEHVNDGWNSCYQSPLEEIQGMSHGDRHLVFELYQHWFNRSGKIERDDNMLTFKSDSAWQEAYDKAAIQLLTTDTDVSIISPEMSIYGWHDYKATREIAKSDATVVAINHIVEDSWDEFNGTFADANPPHVGIFAEMTYSNGRTYFVRWEGDLMEALTKTIRRNWKK